ncbi:MAG: CorA family divalent cation transporter [Thermosynechococcaceae cyanobacterium]
MTLPSGWAIPLVIKQRLGQKEAGQQRAMVADNHLLLILHKVPKSGSRKRTGVFFWRNPNGDWQYSGGGNGLEKLRSHVKAYSEAEQKLTDQYGLASTSVDYFHLLENIGPLRRATENLQATLQAAREAIADDLNIIDLRDASIELTRTLDLLYADAKNALDYTLAKQAEEQALLSHKSVQTAQRLNILAAVFLPLTALSSLFGMNLRSGLENQSGTLFWLVLVGGIGLGVITRDWILRGKVRS